MTAIRKSYVFAFEDEFGKGIGAGKRWISPPPGFYMTRTENRSTARINAAGTKLFETVAYGVTSNSWEMTFVLDYEHLELLLLAFEKYYAPEDVSNPYPGTHYFTNANNIRRRSATIREKILNRMAGGKEDETNTLVGVVCKSVRFSKSAGGSQVNVAMSGFYVNSSMDVSNLESTDYKEYNGDLVEFSCLLINDRADGLVTDADTEHIANTESITLGMEYAASQGYDVCSAIATYFSEDRSTYNFSTSCYAIDPGNYKRRLYSGGVSNTPLSPLNKGLAPINKLFMASYNKSILDGTAMLPGGQMAASVPEAITASDKTAIFTISKCIIKSLTWQKGDGSKLMDQISGAECRTIDLAIKSGYTQNLLTDPQNPL